MQPLFLRLAFGGALVAFVLLEIIRVHRIPPFAEPLHQFLHRFTDARDSGPLILRSAPPLAFSNHKPWCKQFVAVLRSTSGVRLRSGCP